MGLITPTSKKYFFGRIHLQQKGPLEKATACPAQDALQRLSGAKVRITLKISA